MKRLLFAAAMIACGTSQVGGDAASATDACAFCVDAGFDATLPAPVACPAIPPVAGTPCDVPSGEDCEYGTNDYFCNAHFVCAGTWHENTTLANSCSDAEACSTVSDGGACTAIGQTCASGDASVCVCSECGGGPPPPGGYHPSWACFSIGAGCAVDRPNLGSTCDLPDGSICTYARNTCCTGVIEQCASGVWVGATTEPCP